MATSSKSPAKKQAKDPLEGLSSEQIKAAIRAHQDLEIAGVSIPAKIKQIVQAFMQKVEESPSPVEEEPESTTKSGPIYVRSLVNMPFSFRWNTENDKKRTMELKSRGQRGDLHPIASKDLQDSAFQDALQTNLSLGVIEILSAAEAQQVIAGQTTNIQQVHTPLSVLRSETGKEYDPENVKLTASLEDQGVVVGHLKHSEGSNEVGEISSGNRKKGVDWEQTRSGLGGNPHLLSDGFATEQVTQFVPTPDPHTQSQIADQVARAAKGAQAQGPEAVLGDLKVSMGPVVKGKE